MSTAHAALFTDYHLVARAQGRATGANAHEVHALIANYLGMSAAAAEDARCQPRADALERRLRAFCQTGVLPVPPAEITR